MNLITVIKSIRLNQNINLHSTPLNYRKVTVHITNSVYAVECSDFITLYKKAPTLIPFIYVHDPMTNRNMLFKIFNLIVHIEKVTIC